jgi:hypothetical protein
MLKQKWKYVLSGLFLCVLLGFGAIWYFLARSSSTVIERELILVSLTNTPSGPIARFEALNPWYLRKTIVTQSRTVCALESYQYRQWIRFVDPNALVTVTPFLHRGGLAIEGGSTVEVQVPVCEKWRIKCQDVQRRQFRTGLIPIHVWITNQWESAELPGWSVVKKEFNAPER